MAYNSLIPAANDLLSQSQSEIQENFAQIQTLIGINHINFGAAGAGKHLYLQMPEHAAPATAVNEAGFYANVGATSTATELFFRRENNGASIPMTECLAAATGWTFLPSGIMLQWGTVALPGPDTPFTFATLGGRAFPNNCFSINLSFITAGGTKTDVVGILVGSLNAAGFTARSYTVNNNPTAEASSAYYFAIGN